MILRIPQAELRKRVKKLLGNTAVEITGVFPTYGGKLYHVALLEIGRYGTRSPFSVTFTVWEIIDAQDFYGCDKESMEERANNQQSALSALELDVMPETLIELKKTFRKLAKIHHPDAGGNADLFRYIEGAYRLLSQQFEVLELV